MKDKNYRFANRLWFDYVTGEEFGYRFIFALAAPALFPWIIGFYFSLYNRSQINFIQTPAFYIGSLGIFLTAATLSIGSRWQYGMYSRFLDCFSIDDQAKNANTKSILAQNSSFYKQCRASFLIFIFGIFLSSSGFFIGDELYSFFQSIGTDLPRLKSLSDYGWYNEDNIWTGSIIVGLYVLFASPFLGTSASIIIRMPIYLWKTANFSPKIPPALVKFHFSTITRFYTIISILWLIGALSFLYVFGLNNDWLSYTLTSLPFLAGIINFTIPQLAYVRVISSSEELFLSGVSDAFSDRVKKRDMVGGPLEKNQLTQEAPRLEALIRMVQHDGWVYPIHQTYIVVGFYAISIMSSLISWKSLLSSNTTE